MYEEDETASVSGINEATAVLENGVLRIETNDNAGGATRTYTTARSLTGYRYLRVRFRSVGHSSVPARIAIGGYSWNLTSENDGAWVETDIDLCLPDSVNTESLGDAWDTRWPVPTGVSATSGPHRVGSIAFEGIPTNRTIEVDSLTLVRVNAPTVDLVPTLYPSKYFTGTYPYVAPGWPLSQNASRSFGTGGEGTSSDYVRRFLLANSDGRQGPEEPDFWYTESSTPSGVTSFSFNHLSIAGLASEINSSGDVPLPWNPWNVGTDPAGNQPRWPGWTATVAVPDPGEFVPAYANQPAPADPYYYNAQQILATELIGGGAYYNNGWTFGFDRPIGSIPAQPLFDAVEMCGMEGDAFGHGGGAVGEGTLTLVAAAILRAGAHGLTLNAGGKPAVGAAVDLMQDDVVVSSGTSRTPDGWYHTSSLPFGRPPDAIGVVKATSSASPTVSLGTLYTRHRHRATLVAVPVACPCCSLLTGDPLSYVPFPQQFSDANILSVEEPSLIYGMSKMSRNGDGEAERESARGKSSS